ncbi:hypothetical protein CAEBREN_00308 [Caenorhabditis brenneri]|uniref:AWS domain-containing protein n=1 Tax=Caenorhabditis brenneri TaxID=135651 RepID=G0PDU8_CAEBE|nr:hypothetical protein CAEBREN_00308 [Caenorhabditis brenneri]
MEFYFRTLHQIPGKPPGNSAQFHNSDFRRRIRPIQLGTQIDAECKKDAPTKIDQNEKITELEFDETINAFNTKKTKSAQCNCHEKGQNCSDSGCDNRASYMKCPQKCKATNCQNQRFAEKKYAKTRKAFMGPEKGYELVSDQDIPVGKFIMSTLEEPRTMRVSRKSKRRTMLIQNATAIYSSREHTSSTPQIRVTSLDSSTTRATQMQFARSGKHLYASIQV